MKWHIHTVCIFVVMFYGAQGLGDPYKILGVHRTALPQEIRKAYKKLAIEWHPDKNNDPSAETKFVEINQAYELLSDPERRKHYDKFGITENGPQFHRKNEYSQYRTFDPFEDLFGFPQGFDFKFESRDISLFHKLSITTRAYENKLVPKSYRSPQLVLFYTDWCVACFQVEPVWRRVLDELEPLGVGASTVHTEKEQLLARKLGVHGLPCLIVLLDGRPAVYKDSLYSVQKIVEFVRNKFPYKLVQPVTDDTVDTFLSGWNDNRIRALIFERQETVRLRYLLMAFYYRDRVAFGFVQLTSPNTQKIVQHYQVPLDIESLLLFNENSQRPTASLSMADIPVKTMRDVIDNNKYLLLPRLSSQAMLDALCPVEWARPRKRLCVVLISENTPYHDEPRQALRQLAQDAHYSPDRVRFAYIYKERQHEFVAALTSGVGANGDSEDGSTSNTGGAPEEPSLHIVVIWRRDASHLKYEWAPHEWQASTNNEWNETRAQLESTIERLLRTSEALSYEAVVNELIDEHAQGVATRLVNRLLLTVEFFRDNVTKDQILPVLSVVATLVLILAAGYLMAYLVRLEEENIKNQPKRRTTSERSKSSTADTDSLGNDSLGHNNNRKWTTGLTKTPSTPQLRLHELRAETYNGMVRLIKPGCRTLVLLVDSQSRNKLLPDFHRMVWPYRKNKTLMFGHLSLDKGLEWYKNLLTLSLPEPRELNINPRNCIGTVLSLNGHRKYFCMYHAKHPECVKGKGSKRMVKMTRHLGNNNDRTNTSAAFMGFETSESEDTDTSDLEQGSRALDQASLLDSKYGNVVFQGNLLDGFPNWLDRLFEGSTHRYYINYWPDFTPK